jgi:WD40 repeat protein
MPSQPAKVFISYSHDSSEHKERVLALAERLREDGVEARIDRYVNGTPAEGWPRWMENQLEWADFILLVCTETYYRRFRGREQPERGRGVDWEGALVTNEIYQDRSLTTKFVPVLFSPTEAKLIPRPLLSHTRYILDTEEKYSNLLAFLVGRGGVSPGSLGTMREISNVRVEPLRFEIPKAEGGSMGKLNGVPELPPHYLPRLGDFTGLKHKLLVGIQNAVITGQAPALGVQGMGGIGKTVLAAALAHNSEVRRAFPDGIYWMTVGQNPDLLDLQNQLFHQLTGSKETLTKEQEAKDTLRQALEGRSALIVIDDAWTIDHANAFSVTAPPARLLITTRNNEVLVGLGAEEHCVVVLSPNDALKMLAEWVGQRSLDKLPVETAEVAKECGYLPLALAMIGAMIRLRPTAWKDVLDRLRRSDLAAIKRSLPNYPYPNLLRAVEVSIDALDNVDRERYLDLAVFPQDQPIPESTLCLLWRLDAVSTRDCMAQFVACSLATWATSETTTLILHDLQWALIHKRRENSLSDLHLRLLEAWDALPKLPDWYAWRWVAYHLAKAGRKDDLRRLLLTFNYLEAKLDAAHPNGLIADYDYLADEEELRLIQSAIQLSSHILAADTRQLAEQLTGRLLGNAASNIQGLLKQAADSKTSAWLRPLHPNLTPPGGLLIRTLEGHISSVNAVAITPDGRWVVSASADGTLRVWNLESGRTVRRLEGHTGWVNAVAVTPDGRRAISASGDETLRVWDLDTGQTIRRLQDHWGRVRGVAITPDGRRAVSASADRTLRIWDLDTCQIIGQLQGHLGRVRAVAVTPDGSRAISASADRTLRLWDLESGKTIRTFEGHSDWINAVTVTPDGRQAVSASADRTLRVWDLESGQTVRSLEGHAARVRAAAITPDGLHVVSASADGTLRVWDLESGQTLRTLKGHADSVIAVAITPDGHHAVSASVDQTLRVWDLKSSQIAHPAQGHTGRVRAVAVTPDGRNAISASADRTLRVWDIDSGQTVRTLQGHSDWVRAVVVTPDGHSVVSASADRTLRVWDLDSGQTIRRLEGHTDWVYGVAVTPDGHGAVSASADRTLRVWDLDSGQTVDRLEGHKGRVHAVAITSDGHRALSASADGTLRVWDLDSGLTVHTLQGHAGSVVAVAITPDGHRALSASADGTLRVWDLDSGLTVRLLEGQTARVRAVAATLDGCRVLSASYDQALRVWDLDSGREIAAFIGESRMSSCAFAPNGPTIIGGDEAGGVHFLRLVEPDKTEIPIVNPMILLIDRKESTTLYRKDPRI